MPTKGQLKCNRCLECDGFGCPNMLPGLGGVFDGKNFQLNYEAWRNLKENAKNNGDFEKIKNINVTPEKIGCGPVTGSVENIGYENEEDFYRPYVQNADNAGFNICIGDGCPDEKLKFGIEAVKSLPSKNKAAFFLKPYPDEKLHERIKWVKPYAKYIGIDIDSYNIATMRNLVHLERKSAEKLKKIREFSEIPFVIKGVFTEEDIELVKEVKPDVVYISNHGGRVETRIGSTGDFLATHAKQLKEYCNEIWVDGGIRTKEDIQTALFYGADKVILARPLVIATFDENYEEQIKKLLN